MHDISYVRQWCLYADCYKKGMKWDAPLSTVRDRAPVEDFGKLSPSDWLRSEVYIGWRDVTESTATIRSPFCVYNME